MRFKTGDLVIKTTGGNKMVIYDIIPGNQYKCFWFIGSDARESVFSEDDIVTLDDYKKYLKIEERDDKINQVLNG